MDRRKWLLCVIGLLMFVFLSGIFYYSRQSTDREHSKRSTLVSAEVKDDKTGEW